MESVNLQGMNAVDILILAIICISIFLGFARGFISEIISLLSLIAAFVIAIAFTHPLATYFNGTAMVQSAVSSTTNAIGTSTATPVSYMTIAISFAILFFATLIVGSIIKTILNLMIQRGFLGFGNRILGAGFGLVRGYLFVLALIFMVQLSPLAKETWWTQSKTVPYFQPQVVWLGSIVSPALDNLKSTFGTTIDDATDSAKSLINGQPQN